MRLVIISDLHMDAVTAGVQRFDEGAAALRAAARRAREWKATLVVLGDVTDPGTGRAHRAAAECVDVAEDFADVDQVWIAGNHDVIEDGVGCTTLSVLAALRNERVLVVERPILHELCEGEFLVCLPYTALAYDYDPAEFVRDVAKNKWGAKERVVFLGHLNAEGITAGSETSDMPRGRNVFWPLEEIAGFPVSSKRRVLIGGHYHTAQKHGELWIVGAPARFTHGEEEHKPGWLEMDEDLKVRRVPLPNARILLTTDGLDTLGFDAGSIIRLRPHEAMSEEEVRASVRDLELQGAVVRVEPAVPPMVFAVAGGDGKLERVDPPEGPAEAVARRISQLNVSDEEKAAVERLCNKAMVGA